MKRKRWKTYLIRLTYDKPALQEGVACKYRYAKETSEYLEHMLQEKRNRKKNKKMKKRY